MKKIMKKLNILFAIVIVAMLFAVSSSADSQEDYNFIELSNGSLEITQYVGSKTEIYIPSEIDGKSVTSIASYAFSGCSTIEEVFFPDCITKLGKNIFSGCTNLTRINLPKNLKTCLYDHSVSSYTSAAGAIIYKHYYYGPFASSNIINVVVPEGLVHIPEYTFYGCNTIENIIFPSSIKTIGAYAFYSTNKLNNVYYAGTNDAFLDIQINANNANLLNAKWNINHTHLYSSFVLVKPTCSLPGKIKYVCECSAEYVETVEATGHDYVEEITVVATCMDEGLKTYTCFCGDSYIEKIAKKAHSYTSSVTTQPTCTKEGVKTYKCSCGASYTESIAKKSHTIVTDKAVSATCTKTGLTEGKHCSACGTVTVAQKTVAALGHKDANGDYKCDNGCGYEYDRPAPDTPSDPSKDCSCNCHKGGIAGFFFKIILFFQKLFKTNKVCACGVAHY